MNQEFALNHDCLTADRLAPDGFASGLMAFDRIDSPDSFNRYCQTACRLWQETAGIMRSPSAEFTDLLTRIERSEPGTIRTGWGGVVVTLHEHPRVEKFLVIRRGGYLALEKHAEKDEHLEVRSGMGLLLSRQMPDEPLFAELAAPGKTFHFSPGMEHCLIGTDNLLVFERSTDPKGMDQDLIFLYEPQSAT